MDLLSCYNLRIKREKCKWFMREILFLGHIVGHEGISVDPEKISAVRDWPRLSCLNELMSFVGLATY